MKFISTFLLSFLFATSLFAQNTFTLSSQDVGGQASITELFNGFGCTGKNQSPQLSWINAPEGTNSFAVTMYDPDAPIDGEFCHWVMFDIPSNISELVSNAGDISIDLAPEGAIQSNTDYGVPGYGGLCPPEGHGLHQYIITVYALKTKSLGLDANTNPALVSYNLWMNTIGKSSIVFYYQR